MYSNRILNYRDWSLYNGYGVSIRGIQEITREFHNYLNDNGPILNTVSLSIYVFNINN